jgi:Uncharacterized archaeal coiled-coil protein
MIRKVSFALIGAGLVSALSLAGPNYSQADPYGRYSRYENNRRPAARQEIRQDWREIGSDRAELRRDAQEYNSDLDALRRAQRRGASPAEIARTRNELRQDAREITQDRRELREDYAELRRDLDRYSYYNNYNYDYYRNGSWWGWNNTWWGRANDRWDYRWD